MLIQRPKRPLFSPPNPAIRDLPPARNKGDRSLNVLTATGTVTLRRRYFWSRSTGGLCPVDVRVGIHHRTVTTGACCILCTLGVIHDFKQAAEDLHTVAGIRVSAERLRQIVEAEGRGIVEARLLRNYLTERWEMVDYRRAVALGWDIGSGPTEAMCKNLTLRLKRTGMKWDPSNAAAVMNLVTLRESGQWDAWWTRSAA